MREKPTKGPWKFEHGDICVTGPDGDERIIAGIGKSVGLRSEPYWVVGKREGHANAQLICAAPDMLAALQSAEQSIVDFMGVTETNAQSGARLILDEVREAIAKASN